MKFKKLVTSLSFLAIVGFSVTSQAGPSYPTDIWSTGDCANNDVTLSDSSAADECLGLLWEAQDDDVQNISTNADALTFINSVNVWDLGGDGTVGGDVDNLLYANGLFDGGWTFLDKKDGPDASDIAYDVDTGTWSYSGAAGLIDDEDVMVMLKQSTQTSVYLFSNGLDSSGFLNLAVNEPFSQPGLSHFSIYTREGTTVPEPGTLILLSLGLFGLGVARRAK